MLKHVKEAHGKKSTEALNLIDEWAKMPSVSLSAPVQIVEPQKQEGAKMAEDKKPDYCPECHKREIEAKLTERDHRDELKDRDSKIADLTTNVSNLTSENTALKTKPEPAATAPTPAATEVPHATPTPELFAHWQDCPTCKPMLEERGREIRENVLNQLTKDEVSQAMKRHGIKSAPKEIIITSGVAK